MLRSYEAKIPGTRYVCYLERDQDQWVIRLKLMGHLEHEFPLSHLTVRNVKEGVSSLLTEIHQDTNELIIENITQELTKQLGPLLSQGDRQKSKKVESSELGDVVTAILARLEKLEERVAELESRLEKRED